MEVMEGKGVEAGDEEGRLPGGVEERGGGEAELGSGEGDGGVAE